MKILRHDSHLGSWEMALEQPAPALRGLVDLYAGYDERGTSFTRRHELPSAHAVMIVNLGDPITIIDTAGQVIRIGTGDGFGAGLSDAYAVSESGGSQNGMQVMFTPQGARRFFRLPMHLLTNRVFALHDLLGPIETGRLVAGLQAAPDWAARFAVLDAVILARLRQAVPFDLAGARETAWALRRLDASQGRLGIAALADEIGCSRKHLAAQFREHVGLGPKTVARLLRFQHVLRLVEADADVHWAAIAQTAGYFDQAHFTNDFRQITGRSPGEYLAARLPDQKSLPVG